MSEAHNQKQRGSFRAHLWARTLTLAVVASLALLLLPGAAAASDPFGDLTGGSTSPLGSPTISSDKADYSPGETVTLTGDNWLPGEHVHITVNDNIGQTWLRESDVNADAGGAIRDEFQLPTSFIAEYAVTATGDASGTARTTFTDGNVKARSNAAGITYRLDWTVHVGSNAQPQPDCKAPAASQTTGFQDPVGFAGGDQYSNGVNSNSSIVLKAADVSNDGRSFTGWTGETTSDTFLTRTDTHEICVPGDFTGNRTYVANYALNTAPTVTRNNATVTVNEGATAANTGTWADANAGDTVTLSASVGTVTKNANGTWSWSYGTTDGPDQSQTVTITATDNHLASSSTTFSLTVNNVAPAVTAAANQTASEGTSKSFNLGSFTDPGADSPWAVDVDWGDGSTHTTFNATSTGTLAAQTHTYADNKVGGYTVTVKVTDKDGSSDTKTFNVSVANVAPTATFSNNGPVDEGSSFKLTLSGADDVSSADKTAGFTYAFDCGDGGGYGAFSGTAERTCATTDNGTRSVQAKIKDKDGGVSEYTDSVAVRNVVPSVVLSGDASANEGATKSYSYTWTDPGSADSFPAAGNSVDCGSKGTASELSFTPASKQGSFKCTFSDDSGTGTFAVTATVTDDDDGVGSDTKNVDVDNVAPTATFTGGATSPNEDKNGSELYTVSVSDPGSDGFTVKTGFPDCGTGGSLIDDSLTTTANSASFRCRFADGPATPTVRMQVRDADEPAGSTTADSNIATRAVTVNNVAPVVNLSGPNEAEEGDTKTYTFTLSDPGDDTFSFVSGTTDYPSCGAYGTLVGTPAVSDGSFQCRFPDGPNTTDVAIKIKDDDGGVSAPDVEHVDIISVDIANVAPALTAPDNQSSDEGEDKSFALGSFSDPGPDSPWAVDVDWGDGSTDTTFDATSTGTLAAQTHTYADNNVGGYTVTVKVTDKNGSSDTKSFNVNVANVAPKVVLSGDASANEGATKSYSYTWTDPGSADTFPGADNSVDCGSNGTASEVSFTPASKQGSFKCTFSDDSGTGTFAVNATVTDDDGGVGSDTKQVDVDNVAPTVSFTGGPTEVNEDKNGSELYEVSVSDPGSDGFTVKGGFPDCGTGGSPVANSLTTTASGASFRCRFSDGPATPTVRMQVRDADEPAGSTTADSNVATRDVKVNNVAPVVNLTDPPNTAQEGDTKTYNFALSDPGEDTFSFVSGTTDYPSCGAYGVRVGTPAVSDGSFQCRFPDGPNNTDVAIKIKDDDGGVSSADVEHVDIINVSIANLAPALTAPDNQSANEGVDKSFALGSFSDPGPDSPWAVEVDWGDGSTDTTFDVIAAGPVTDKAITAQSHTYADNGAYVVTVTVTDKNGDLDSEMFTATVNNVAPTATFTNNGPVDEGSDFKLSLTNANDVLPDKQAGFTFAFDCGDGAPDGAFSGTDERTCPTTDNGTRTVKATIKDKDGGEQEYTGSVTVRNVAPTVTAAADQTANEGSSKSFNLGSFADPGPDSPWAVDVDWGDSSGHTTFNTTTKGTLDAKSHTYADNKAGGYTVTVKVTDKDGGSDTKTFTADVQNVAPTASNGTFVFDPVLGTATAGFDFTDPGTADKHGPSLSYFTWSGVDRFASVTETNGSGHASDTRTLNPGCYNLTVTGTAKDKDLAPSAALPIYSGSQTSVYAKGFRPPIVDNERNIVKYGNVVPVKVALTNSCTGAAVTNVSLYIETVQGSGSEIIEGTTVVAESVSAADTTGQMRIADSMYIYNLATKTMTQGKDYTIRIRLGASNGPVILAAVLQPKK